MYSVLANVWDNVLVDRRRHHSGRATPVCMVMDQNRLCGLEDGILEVEGRGVYGTHCWGGKSFSWMELAVSV